jgi:hypothetical protein
VLIGTTTDNGAKFQVSGAATFSSTLRSGSLTVSDVTANTFFYNTFINAANRNWALAFGIGNLGDFNIMSSNVEGGNPISTAGNSKLNIQSNGNLGIATISPQLRLHVVNNQTSDVSLLQLRLEGNGGNYFDLGRKFTTGSFIIQGNQTGTNNICLAPTSGNVLIGTETNNGTKFQVASAVTSSTPAIDCLVTGSGRFQRGFRILNSGMSGNTDLMLSLGQSESNRNMGQFYYHYAGSNSTNNRASIGLFGVDDVLNVMGSGNVLIGTTTDSGSRLRIVGATNSSFDFGIIINNLGNDSLFAVRDDGVITTGFMASGSPTNNTTSSAANMHVDTSGVLRRSTSSLKYKKNVESYEKGLNEVMQLKPVSYQGKNPADGNQNFAGLIAEEVHNLGLTEFVQYAKDGSPDALSYQNMIALLTKAIQELKQEIDTLKN